MLGVGDPTSFLVPSTHKGQPVWVENPFFTYTMFSPPLARIPAPIVVTQDKPAGEFRVVVLGESAAQGDPIPDFGVPRVLKYRLRQQYPEARVEVINAAITAINSHAIKQIAQDLDKLAPDVVILYVGNNEVIGPYGPGTAFSGYVQQDFVIDFAFWVNRLRITQAARQVMALARDRKSAENFGGVGMFLEHPVPAHDPRLTTVYRRYERNLAAIITSARAAGAKVLVSTVAVNRKACPPSISVNDPTLTPDRRQAWDAAFERGKLSVQLKDWSRAVEEFKACHAMDPGHAELNYWLALSLEEAGRVGESEVYWSQAMNADAFRYRTDDRQNDIVRQLAGAGDAGVQLADADRLFREQRDGSDEDLFVDHVHFTFEGTTLLADVWIEAMTSWLPWDAPGEVADIEALKNEVMFTALAEMSVMEEMVRRYRRPPFTLQPDNQARIEMLEKRLREISEALREDDPGPVIEAFEARRVLHPDDVYFSAHLAQYLIAHRRYMDAWPVVSGALEDDPDRRSLRSAGAHLLALEGQPDAAADLLLGDAGKHGFYAAMGASYLFKMLVADGYYDEAVAAGDALLARIGPADYRHRVEAGLLDVRKVRDTLSAARREMEQGSLAVADRQLERLSDERPDLGEPLFLRGVIAARQGRVGPGFALAQQGLGRMNFAWAYYLAGLWQARYGTVESAREWLAKAERLAGDDLRLVNSLAWIYAADERMALRDPARARDLLEGQLARRTVAPMRLLDTLAAAYAAAGDFDAAEVWGARAFAVAEAQGDVELRHEIATRLQVWQQERTVGWGPRNHPHLYF